MNPLPQTVPISHLRQRQDEILAMAQKGPVLLLSRSKPAAVLLSPSEWNLLAAQIDELRHLKQEESDRLLAQRIAHNYAAQAEENTTAPESLSQSIFEAIQADRDQQLANHQAPISGNEMRKRMRANGANV